MPANKRQNKTKDPTKQKIFVFRAVKHTVVLLCAASGRDITHLILQTGGKHFCSLCTEKLSFKAAAFKRGLEGCNEIKENPAGSGLTRALQLK